MNVRDSLPVRSGGIVLVVVAVGVAGVSIALGGQRGSATSGPCPATRPRVPAAPTSANPTGGEEKAAAAGPVARLELELARKEREIAKLRAELEEVGRRLASCDRSTAAADAAGSAARVLCRERVREALGRLGQEGPTAVSAPRFRRLVRDLEELGAEGIALAGAQLADGATRGDRFLAAAALAEMGNAAALPFLAGALETDSEPLVRRMAARGLAVGAQAEGRAALDRAMAVDDDWGVRVNAAYGLARLGDRRGLEELVRRYESPATEPQYKLSILSGIAEVGDPSTSPMFARVLESQTDSASLLVAIRGAERTRDPALVPELRRLASTAPAAAVREAAERAAEVVQGLRAVAAAE